MPECVLCNKFQARLNSGNLCKICKDMEIPLIKVNNGDAEEIVDDGELITIIKNSILESKMKDIDLIEHLKDEILHLRKDIDGKNNFITELLNIIKNQSIVNKEAIIEVTPNSSPNCSTPLLESADDTVISESANRHLISYCDGEFETISNISESTDECLNDVVISGQKICEDKIRNEINEVRIIKHQKFLEDKQRNDNDDVSNNIIPLRDSDNVGRNTKVKNSHDVEVETRNSFESLTPDDDDEDKFSDQDVDDFYNNYNNNASITSKDDNFEYVHNNRKTNKRSTVIISDSMTRGIRGKKLKEYTFNQNVYVKTYGGAKPGDIKYLAIPSLKYHPNHVIIHVGSNDIKTRKNADTIANSIIKVCDGIKIPENDVIVSGVIYRRNEEQNIKVDQVNKILQQLCRERNYYFLDNSNISQENLCFDGS